VTGDQWAIVCNTAAIVLQVVWLIRLERRGVRGVDHAAGGCGGLPGRCPVCIELYHRVCGREVVPWCAACGAEHWPYDPHRWDAAGGGAST